ncbi:MAG TPA: type IV secretion system DNA-binding domain-containing protein, partial [Candidatus Saccharimonadales bacterium]|nr:type IV secretion system DNA-binding domain-containing protein [Candidatus Saccharimonadales bacterium]
MILNTIVNRLKAYATVLMTGRVMLIAGLVLLLIVLIYLVPIISGLFFGRRKYAKKFLELTFPSGGQSAVATEHLYSLLHARSKQRSIIERLLGVKKLYSLELVSTAREGIRYIVVIPEKEAEIMHRSLLSYVPGIKVKEISDYLEAAGKNEKMVQCIELKLSSDFVLPLRSQQTLDEYDPLAHLIGHMTKLAPGELVAFQIVATPIVASIHRGATRRVGQLKNSIYREANLSTVLNAGAANNVLQFLGNVLKLIISIPSLIFDPGNKNIPVFQNKDISNKRSVNPYEKELAENIKHKIDQQLFETSLRVLIIGKSGEGRAKELTAAFQSFASSQQSLIPRKPLSSKTRLTHFNQRQLTASILNPNPILSTAEIAGLYHFPHSDAAQAEDLAGLKSPELPAPLVLKNQSDLDVVFGLNNYGDHLTQIGLTDDERSRHMYLIGQTGAGKSTAIYHMASGDIQKGRGLAVIDPHGDLAEDLLASVPQTRINDLIYFNPFDIRHPIGVNLLELSADLEGDELELEKELVCESVVSIFRRVFNKEEHSDAHRIEYILRNTIHTAFTVENATIFTVYELLNHPKFQKQVVSQLTNEDLKHFWKNEFGKAGNYQVVKMVSGVTAKIGRFLLSPIAKRILEQPHSTINFDDILDGEKILICNLAEGKLGEDTSQLLGTMVIAKIHQAALRRARKEALSRKPFYLFVDEFQNFATSSFTKLLSGGRKFGLRITIAEQSTAQQSDRSIVNVILANTGVMVCFRTASPIDEELMLSQMSPTVKPGEIGNLPRHHFYMRLAAIEAESPFSGETIPINHTKDVKKVERLIAASRKNYAIDYHDNESSP